MKQQSSIGEQMKQIADKVPRSKMFQLAPLMTIGHDGINHINIWESGETNLGKALSSFTALPFEHSEHGSFLSIEGFWHYIRSVTKDDNLRMLSGHNARTFGRTLESQEIRDVYFVVADANWQKVRSYPALVNEIKNLRIPFDSYYLEIEKDRPKLECVRSRSLHAKYLVPAFHEIHEAIHQNREPDFTFLKDESRASASKFSHPLVARENTDGGFNANLFYMYSKKPVHNKPKKKEQAPVAVAKLEQPSKLAEPPILVSVFPAIQLEAVLLADPVVAEELQEQKTHTLDDVAVATAVHNLTMEAK